MYEQTNLANRYGNRARDQLFIVHFWHSNEGTLHLAQHGQCFRIPLLITTLKIRKTFYEVIRLFLEFFLTQIPKLIRVAVVLNGIEQLGTLRNKSVKVFFKSI